MHPSEIPAPPSAPSSEEEEEEGPPAAAPPRRVRADELLGRALAQKQAADELRRGLDRAQVRRRGGRHVRSASSRRVEARTRACRTRDRPRELPELPGRAATAAFDRRV